MSHNEIAQLFRDELLTGWDDIIYNFSSKYNGSLTNISEIRKCIREEIKKHQEV